MHLMPSAVTESASVARTSAGMVDAARSLALWQRTFTGRAAFEKQDEWIDPASLVMPAQYVIAGSVLAQALENTGAKAESDSVKSDVQRLLSIANLGSVFERGR